MMDKSEFGIGCSSLFFRFTASSDGSIAFWKITILGAIGSGLAVWFFGSALTVGASGIGAAYLGYVLVITHFVTGRQVDMYKKQSYILLGLNVLITSFFPMISVSGHLGGLMVGMVLALNDKKKYAGRMIY